MCQHKRYLRTGLLTHSAVVEHQHETGHTILFENSQVLSKEPHFYDRKIREAIEIHVHITSTEGMAIIHICQIFGSPHSMQKLVHLPPLPPESANQLQPRQFPTPCL
ncbi:hypothetical protein Zmor_001815 [Zophobas morio]|uniref:Uncharacterized protein n=1 Tax=Zophobas morio TaxID=2755281 RepID=A0AA38J602_9CUCU|nr:hypothetical protein Zmor_001815 [Zophobas morio]